MRTDSLTNLFHDEINEIRSVEQQIAEVINGIAEGVSGQRLSQAATRILEATKRHMARLDRLFREMEPERAKQPSLQAFEARRTNLARLTSRETEVLQLIAEGYANKQIAGELAISIKTVEKHRQHLMAKLDLHDTAGVTRFAISVGVVEAAA